MLYDRTLTAGTQVFSLNPQRGPHDSGIIPRDCKVFVTGVDYTEPGNFIHGRVHSIAQDVAVSQFTLGERAYADLGPAVEVRHETLSLSEVDCGGMLVMTGVDVYFRR